MFLYSTAFIPGLELIQSAIKCVPDSPSPGAKRLRRETHHSPPSIADIKIGGFITSLPHTSTWHDA
jgi:hypothetical protein